MNNIFLIADLHFGHKNILNLEYEHRPFSSIQEHDQALKDNWNRVVDDDDLVYVLGDICLSHTPKALQNMNDLKGKKRLVMGNHDKLSALDYLDYFEAVYGSYTYEGYLLTHIPVHPIELNRFKGVIHGHKHSQPFTMPGYVCVSAEQINLTPISILDAIMRLEAIFELHMRGDLK